VTAAQFDLSKVTDRLGVDFDLRANTYKPFPCGIVNHPTIDACIQLHDAHRIPPADIAAVQLRVAPLVLDLCNQTGITKGLQGKFSVYHGAAVGLVRGKAGVQEYTDATVNDPAVKRVRELTRATGDSSITEDQAHVTVEAVDGRRVEVFVRESLGNLRRPLSDAQLEDKFRDQAAVNLPQGVVDALIRQCWQIDGMDDVGALVEASRVQLVR
jgi:2-methylcitrate dehydratase PrpD